MMMAMVLYLSLCSKSRHLFYFVFLFKAGDCILLLHFGSIDFS